MEPAEREFNVKLVSEVENYPCLYDFTLPEYSKRYIIEKAWTEVSQKLEMSG